MQTCKVLVQKELKIPQGCNIDGGIKGSLLPSYSKGDKGFSNILNVLAFLLTRLIVDLQCYLFGVSVFCLLIMDKVRLLQDIGSFPADSHSSLSCPDMPVKFYISIAQCKGLKAMTLRIAL